MKKKIVSLLTMLCLMLPCFFAVACKDKEDEPKGSTAYSYSVLMKNAKGKIDEKDRRIILLFYIFSLDQCGGKAAFGDHLRKVDKYVHNGDLAKILRCQQPCQHDADHQAQAFDAQPFYELIN